jgi:hypothetical protein
MLFTLLSCEIYKFHTTTLPSTPLAKDRVSSSSQQKGADKRQKGAHTAKLGDAAWAISVNSDGADGVLVNSVEFGVVLDLALEIHLLEHVQCRLFASVGHSRASL